MFDDLLQENKRYVSGFALKGIPARAAKEFGLVTCMGVFNPVFATYRLDQIPTDRVARVLSAWSVTSKATIAAMTALWGLLASITSLRAAIAIAGLLIVATPLLLPRRDHVPQHERELPPPSTSRLGTCDSQTSETAIATAGTRYSDTVARPTSWDLTTPAKHRQCHSANQEERG